MDTPGHGSGKVGPRSRAVTREPVSSPASTDTYQDDGVFEPPRDAGSSFLTHSAISGSNEMDKRLGGRPDFIKCRPYFAK